MYNCRFSRLVDGVVPYTMKLMGFQSCFYFFFRFFSCIQVRLIPSIPAVVLADFDTIQQYDDEKQTETYPPAAKKKKCLSSSFQHLLLIYVKKMRLTIFFYWKKFAFFSISKKKCLHW